MSKFNSIKTVKANVLDAIRGHVAIRGETWLLTLGYAACNDFAQLVANEVSVKSGYYTRFETVARYIRAEKASIRSKITTA